MGSGIIVYGLSLKLRILRLIEVVCRWFSKRKHILRQLTCWCAIFSGNISASCDRAYRSARRLRNGRGYKLCLSIICNVIDKQRLRIRLGPVQYSAKLSAKTSVLMDWWHTQQEIKF